MRLTLTRSEIEKICVDRFRLMEDLVTDLTTIGCKWLSEPGLLEITIEPWRADERLGELADQLIRTERQMRSEK